MRLRASGPGGRKEQEAQADWTLLCLRCREAFATKGELKAHPCLRPEGEQEAEGGPPPRPKRHQCSICLKAFARPWSLSRHRLVHSTDRPFVCPDCGLAFRLASYLRQHRRVHAGGPAPHLCPRCPRRFSRAYSLLRHQRCHRAELELERAAALQALQAQASQSPAPLEQEAEGLPLPVVRIKEEPPSPGTLPQSPAAPPVFLSASCFDSQDHSAFKMEEDEVDSKAQLRGLGGLAS
ncbi:Zinc finger protein 579 [Heterocephalus glaber]|uniref:Zinc finger protein 579 n=1 Tax=Heterocephalus glaber TaxID=10181 RepID=G5BVY5_HETGA|nr:Zinc finger protein 579 [Heterocephalus glaber]